MILLRSHCDFCHVVLIPQAVGIGLHLADSNSIAALIVVIKPCGSSRRFSAAGHSSMMEMLREDFCITEALTATGFFPAAQSFFSDDEQFSICYLMPRY